MMNNELIYGGVVMLGAVMGVVIPYLLKVFEDPTLKFDIKYTYALLMNILMQVIGLIPDTVPDITFRVLVTAFAAGYGIQTIINKVVTLWQKE